MYVTQFRQKSEQTSQGFAESRSGYRVDLVPFSATHIIQNTYSWRTRKGMSMAESEDDDLFQSTSGNQSDFMSDLRKSDAVTYDKGHEFWTETLTTTYGQPMAECSRKAYTGDAAPPTRYVGPITPPLYTSAGLLPVIALPPDATKIAEDGTQGVSQALPTKAAAGLLVALAELKQDFPNLPGWVAFVKREGSLGKRFGDEYLNYQFGIAPTVSDIQKLAAAVRNKHKLLETYVHDARVSVRRRREVYDHSDVVERGEVGRGTPRMQYIPEIVSNTDPAEFFYAQGGVSTAIDSYRQRCWFAGSFEYFIDDGKAFLGAYKGIYQKLDHLLGLKLTPQAVYQLTPWSWLLDWFGNFGTLVGNFSAFADLDDRLVMKYGYVMHETTSQRAITFTGAVPNSLGTAPSSLSVFSTNVRKERHRATPYGFGLNTEVFNPRQWAILGALGITHGRGVRLDE